MGDSASNSGGYRRLEGRPIANPAAAAGVVANWVGDVCREIVFLAPVGAAECSHGCSAARFGRSATRGRASGGQPRPGGPAEVQKPTGASVAPAGAKSAHSTSPRVPRRAARPPRRSTRGYMLVAPYGAAQTPDSSICRPPISDHTRRRRRQDAAGRCPCGVGYTDGDRVAVSAVSTFPD